MSVRDGFMILVSAKKNTRLQQDIQGNELRTATEEQLRGKESWATFTSVSVELYEFKA